MRQRLWVSGWRQWAEQETPWPVGVREAARQQLPGRRPGRRQPGQQGPVKPEVLMVREGRRPWGIQRNRKQINEI